MKTRTIYLSGPMTGIPDFNRAAFNATAERLRLAGHKVFNPGEEEPPGSQHWSRMEWIIYDLLVMKDGNFDTLAQLPGWTGAHGACIEFHAAGMLGMEIMPEAEIA